MYGCDRTIAAAAGSGICFAAITGKVQEGEIMSNTRKSIITTAVLLLIVLALMPFVTKPAHAEPAPMEMDPSEITFTNGYVKDEYFKPVDSSVYLYYAETSDPSVATVDLYQPELGGGLVNAIGVGTCTIKVYDATEPSSATKVGTINVTVTEAYMEDRFKAENSIEDYSYGNKKLKVYGWPGVSYKLKINDKTIKKGTLDSSGKATIKLDKVYKLGAKISYKMYNDKYSTKVKDKIYSATWVKATALEKNKKKLTLKIFDLHKGDTVKFKWKGKTYTKKIKKDTIRKWAKVKFTLKSVMTKSGKFTVYVTNKDKKQLCKEKIKMTEYDSEGNYADD